LDFTNDLIIIVALFSSLLFSSLPYPEEILGGHCCHPRSKNPKAKTLEESFVVPAIDS
jgi:hypothetical protein